jgi:hypothetical protein
MTCNGKHEVRACFFKYPIIQTTAVQRRMRQLADMGYHPQIQRFMKNNEVY